MANRFFIKYKQALANGTAGPDLDAGAVKVVGIELAVVTPDTGASGDEYYSDISAGAKFTPTALTNPSLAGGVLSADPTSLPDPGGGADVDVLVIFHDTGTPSTSRLIALIDVAPGLPYTLDGAADLLTFASGQVLKL